METAGQSWFTQTHWTTVLGAVDSNSTQAQQALAKLCQAYWYPLYAFIRRRGYPPHDAQDLTQSFFLHLFEHDTLRRVAREKGKFRSFLLRALQHFLANEWDKVQTVKRGGQIELISWDQATAEGLYTQEPHHTDDAERLFDHKWASALIEQAIEKLRYEQSDARKALVFATLQRYLTGETSAGSYAEAAAKLNLTEGAVKVALHRLRRRFGEVLRNEIAHTVTSSAEIDEEIGYLFGALARADATTI